MRCFEISRKRLRLINHFDSKYYYREKNEELTVENKELKFKLIPKTYDWKNNEEKCTWEVSKMAVAGKNWPVVDEPSGETWQDSGQVVWKQIWTSERKEMDSSSDQVNC